MPGIGDEAAALLELVDDLLSVGRDGGAGFFGGGEVDFAEAVFLGALGGLEPVKVLLHLVLGDVDERLDIAA